MAGVSNSGHVSNWGPWAKSVQPINSCLASCLMSKYIEHILSGSFGPLTPNFQLSVCVGVRTPGLGTIPTIKL